MASSKFYLEEMLVPPHIIVLAAENPLVVCNLRPSQRRDGADDEFPAWVDGYFVQKPVHDLLRLITPPQRVAILFQGYGNDESATAVVDITQVFWAGGGYPALHFEHPAVMREVYGCPTFWGAFILAIALTDAPVQAAKGSDLFVQLMKNDAK